MTSPYQLASYATVQTVQLLPSKLSRERLLADLLEFPTAHFAGEAADNPVSFRPGSVSLSHTSFVFGWTTAQRFLGKSSCCPQPEHIAVQAG